MIHARIIILNAFLENNPSPSEIKLQKSDDPDASLDIKIASTVDEKVFDSAQAGLMQLKQSLNWLDSEDAGYCDDCGCEIPLARLKAASVTRLCLDCAEKKITKI